jgi:dynein heavy chain
MKEPCLFGDYAMANPTDDEAEDPRLYEDLGEIATIKDKLDRMLEDYGFDHKPMHLVLFNDALKHVTKIHRIIRFPKGCGLLVGFGGSGKQSLTRLSSFICSYTTVGIIISSSYGMNELKADL